MSRAEKTVHELSNEKVELLRLLREEKKRQAQRIKRVERQGGAGGRGLAPTSSAQRRLWFIDQLEGGTTAYNMALAIRLRGALDDRALQAALDDLIRRHEVLRTVFVNVDGEPQQEIAPHARFSLQVVDLQGNEADVQAQVREQRLAELHERFDLRMGPLIRGRLLHLEAQEHVLLVTMHHIISDGWSLGVFFREVTELYRAHREGRAAPLEPLPIQYADYAHWQSEWLQGKQLQRELAYWRAHLEGAPPQIELPSDRSRPVVQSYRGESLEFVIDAELTARLRACVQRNEMTLFMVLYAAWAILLARLSGQEDVVIGTPIANRGRPEIEGLIGFFVNTLALRIPACGELSLEEYFAQVKDATLEAYAHQDVPFELVVEAVQPERSLSRHPLFQAVLVLQNTPKSELHLPGLTATIEDGIDEPAMFDLLLSLEERGEVIVAQANYAVDLFDRRTIERWLSCFQQLLREVTKDARRTLNKLPILPDGERRELLSGFNATATQRGPRQRVHELFEEQVRRTPEAVAVVHGGSALTYAQLNARSNQLARELRRRGVGPDVLVGICIERSVEMVIGVLAIMKAGGAYVPLDPSYPPERLRDMLADAAPALVLTQRSLSATLLEQIGQDRGLIFVTEQLEALAAEDDSTVMVPSASGRDLVYVIYTSGSSGRPKGTGMGHDSMVNLIEWHQRTFGPSEGKRVLQFAALSFDVAFQELATTLGTGGQLVLLDEWMRRDVRALSRLLREQRIERLFIPPLMLQALAEHVQLSGERFEHLQDVIAAGEALRISEAVVELFRGMPGSRLHNHYGPTETHVVTALTLSGDPTQWPALPSIGRPIANIQIHILDEQRELVPFGVVGEIYIAGAGVARGYLRRPELTQQRFLMDPFDPQGTGRMYRTGDLGRWRADGSIEYLGRNDHQVKIRGYRIELGEIEARLTSHPQVRDAAVIAREDVLGEKRLVAYVTRREEATPQAEALRAHIKQTLPEFMVPSAYVVMEKLPQTPNGKLDRRALPAPQLGAFAALEYEPPQGEVEQILADIWQQLLHVERVGRNDNFFELGGHSLHGVKLLTRVADSLEVDLSVIAVFKHPTIRQLATHIASLQQASAQPVHAALLDFEEGVV